MKLAIYSDLHIGRRMYRTDENNYNKYEQIGYRTLMHNVNVIKKFCPDLVINAGDVFDTPNPSVLAMNKYFQAQKMFESANIETMTILGNHDFAFNNRRNHCSAAEMATHTYFADYELKTVEKDGILFVMMPYIYDKAENITEYMNNCLDLANNSTCDKKILVTHGVTAKYYEDSFISDPIMLSNELVEAFNLVIIGHIHTPFEYKQKNTLVISPGAMIDYQAYEDRTGPIILNTDDWSYKRLSIKTPHIIKKKCNQDNINTVLENVTEDIYHISYDGNTDLIDNDLFIKAKNTAVNLVIDVVQKEIVEEKDTKMSSMSIYEWVAKNYPDYVDTFNKAKEGLC